MQRLPFSFVAIITICCGQSLAIDLPKPAAGSIAVATVSRSDRATGGGLGLTVENGRLLRNGRPYRAIGVNYFDLFSRLLKAPNDISYRAGLRQLAQAGIPWVRFHACGFWPIDNDLYRTNKEAYFARLDKIVRAAEEYHVGLIPSLFWLWSTVPDMMGEPMDQLGNRQSKSIRFIRQYTTEVVGRYKDSPAIWGWETGNEYNLAADLPNAAHFRPVVVPSLKTASARSARDEFSSQQMLTVFDEFARAVRRCDPKRIIVSGNSVPRASSYHNTLERSWKLDTAEEFAQILVRDNPDPIDTLGVHVYPVDRGPYPGGAKGLDALIAVMCRVGQDKQKPLFVGEFGSALPNDPARERAVFEELLAAIERNPVPLAAVWVFDFSAQDKQGLNVTFDNARAYQLELIGRANARLRKAMEQ
jgi:hypothetical protein